MPCDRPPAVASVFDVVDWFMDRALNDGEYLQPQKLHRLMYLAQGYYAAAFGGRLLMPGVFIADAAGPIEPNVYRVFQEGRPRLGGTHVPEAVTPFLDGLWRRFGAHSAGHLSGEIRLHTPYLDAFSKEPGAIIRHDAMAAFYAETPVGPGAPPPRSAGKPSPRSAGTPPPLETVLRPRILRSQTGEAVAVTPWLPKPKGPAEPD